MLTEVRIFSISNPAALFEVIREHATIISGKAGQTITAVVDVLEIDRRFSITWDHSRSYFKLSVLCDYDKVLHIWKTHLISDRQIDMQNKRGAKSITGWMVELASLKYGLPYRFFTAYKTMNLLMVGKHTDLEISNESTYKLMGLGNQSRWPLQQTSSCGF